METLTERIARALDRALERSDRSGDCWLFTGYANGHGYGTVGVKMGGVSHMRYAHRLAYERFVGPIPDGYEIDHLCFVRNCMNPAHLEAVTHAENDRRRAARIAHCTRGHEYTEERTAVHNGKRVCLECRADDVWLKRHPDAPLDDPRRRGRYRRS